MKTTLMMLSGAVMFTATFVAWYWLNALGCAMNTTGCAGVTLHWRDWEALQLFIPTFALGLGLMIVGLWLILVRRRSG